MSYKNLSKEDLESKVRRELNRGDYAIFLDFLNLTEFPNLTDLSIPKNFWCDNNLLKNLKGAPKSIGGNFYCYNNPLESLEGLPEYIGGYFVLDKETWDNLPKDTNEVLFLMLNDKLRIE